MINTPSQLNFLLTSKPVTVGLNVFTRASGGSILTVIVFPTLKSPVSEVTKGF